MAGTWPEARYALRNLYDGLTVGALLDVVYDNELTGPFTVGETLTFGGGGTALLTDLDDDGLTGVLSVQMLTGSNPANDETITGGTSSATADVNGDPTGVVSQSLTMLMFAAGARQAANLFPYGYLIPVEVPVEVMAPRQRILEIPLQMRIFLSPGGEDDLEQLHRRFDAWWLALLDQTETSIQLAGGASFFNPERISGLLEFDDMDRGWGFECEFRLRITETRPLTAA